MLRMLTLLLACGGLAMAGQDKKEPPKGRPKEPLRKPYTEYVTVRRYYPEPTGFINPDLHIQAYRGKFRDGKHYIALSMGSLPTPKPGSQIIDADGTVYEVTEAKPFEKDGSPTVCYFKKVKDGKKPEPEKKPARRRVSSR